MEDARDRPCLIVMPFLLDTNIISELRKAPRCDLHVWQWFDSTPQEHIYISVLSLGEMRRGVEKKRGKDTGAARVFEKWLHHIAILHREHTLGVNAKICDIWGHLSVDPHLPPIDGLLAATAVHYNLTVATQNEKDFQRAGVDYFNPFKGGKP
jgi:predicted nucleic acid-binding protein